MQLAQIGHIWDDDQSGLTCGDWRDEPEVEDAFCDFCGRTGAFEIHRQVAGEPLWKRSTQAYQSVRAGVLLLPSPRVLAKGWDCGAVVVEVNPLRREDRARL